MRLTRSLFFCALPPALFCLLLLAFYGHARILLGRFPNYDNPDPKELSAYSFYAPFIYGVLLLSFCSFVSWLIIISQWLYVKKRRIDYFLITAGMACYPAALAEIHSPIGDWFFD